MGIASTLWIRVMGVPPSKKAENKETTKTEVFMISVLKGSIL
jgi:hypothetical protein